MMDILVCGGCGLWLWTMHDFMIYLESRVQLATEHMTSATSEWGVRSWGLSTVGSRCDLSYLLWCGNWWRLLYEIYKRRILQCGDCGLTSHVMTYELTYGWMCIPLLWVKVILKVVQAIEGVNVSGIHYYHV